MQTREQKLTHLLRLEVVDKSYASSFAFIVFAIFSIVYHYNCEKYAWIIQTAAFISILTNLVRFSYCKKINVQKNLNQIQWRTLQIMIWINAFCWSVILNTASYELRLQGTHFIVVTTLIAGFVGSSIVTLAYFSSLFIPFQLFLLIPQIFVILNYYFRHEINLLPLIFLYLMYLFYQLKQYQVYRRENLKRFIYQLDLEIANDKLKKSKDELIDQTVKLVHVSRLAALGEMSAGIAHEINNPLTVIKGGAKLIEKNIARDPIDTESILKQSQKIQNSVTRVTKIVQGLKSFSTLSDGKLKEQADLKDIIEDTLNFCMELLASHGIRLDIDPIPDIKFECHPVQISQVLVNLIKNAQDEILDKDLTESERWIRIQFKVEKVQLHIRVSNGGPRIKDELLEKIFSPFFSTKPVGKGTGLGLSISQKIMREHSGDLTIDKSNPHTAFLLVIPVLAG